MEKFLKNIDHEEVLRMSELVELAEGQVVRKTLAENDAVRINVFSFAKGKEIGTHDSTGDALVTVLEGVGKFTVDGTEYLLQEGQSLVIPAKKPHSIYAVENFKMLLVIVFKK